MLEMSESERIEIIGKIAERNARIDLEQNGWKVAKMLVEEENGNQVFPIQFNTKLVMEVIGEYNGDQSRLIELFLRGIICKPSLEGLPDFICVKDGELKFVEVKGNKSGLSKKQADVKKVLEREDYNYNYEISRFQVGYDEILEEWERMR
jgi:hypothetical protein